MGDGKKAALGIDKYLKELKEDAVAVKVDPRLEKISEWLYDQREQGDRGRPDERRARYNICEITVAVPLVADRAEAGQFVIVMTD